MKVFSSVTQAQSEGLFRGAAVALGNFDGVHLGHQALIRRAQSKGRATAFTFAPHPGKVLRPELAPKLIVSEARKLELLAATGLEALLMQTFSTDYAATTPADFAAVLFEQLQVGTVVVGHDFTYGAKRAGTVDTLKGRAAALGRTVEVVESVTVDGVVVSSSRIREYVLEGRVEAASSLLGRPFDLEGVVVKGQARGRTLGFPTANVDSANEIKPASGVYAVRARIDGEQSWWGGAANIGVKPTFGGSEATIEVHLFDVARDLYGKTLRVMFLARLRGERRFASVAELTAQIARDVDEARTLCAKAP